MRVFVGEIADYDCSITVSVRSTFEAAKQDVVKAARNQRMTMCCPGQTHVVSYSMKEGYVREYEVDGEFSNSTCVWRAEGEEDYDRETGEFCKYCEPYLED